jgi:DMSO/TMAO reductase YedYZ molybdopterin-dependent catalytic subunit
MSESDETPETKLTATKKAWAKSGKFLTGKAARPESERLPPGQHVVKDWPVLDLGQIPSIDRARWRLDIVGAVDCPMSLDLAEFEALPQSRFESDIHCVTTWSRFDNRWDGVSTIDIVTRTLPRADVKFVELQSWDGYTTNLPFRDFAAEDSILATAWNGAPLTLEHGGPVRLVVPHLYFWKSAKWLRRIEFLPQDRPGFWETRGYHDRGDPWAEQRYSD